MVTASELAAQVESYITQNFYKQPNTEEVRQTISSQLTLFLSNQYHNLDREKYLNFSIKENKNDSNQLLFSPNTIQTGMLYFMSKVIEEHWDGTYKDDNGVYAVIDGEFYHKPNIPVEKITLDFDLIRAM